MPTHSPKVIHKQALLKERNKHETKQGYLYILDNSKNSIFEITLSIMRL
jgi:hypothetical protein